MVQICRVISELVKPGLTQLPPKRGYLGTEKRLTPSSKNAKLDEELVTSESSIMRLSPVL